MESTTERNIYTPILKTTPLFKTLSEEEIGAVLVHCVKREYAAGDTILTQGETGNSMLIIVEGAVEYWKGKKKVGSDTTGAFFGEIALLANGVAKRQATVKATQDCVLLEIYQPSFKELLRKYPEIGVLVIQMLASRIQAATPASGLKNRVGLTLVAMMVPMLAKLLSKHMPHDMANETAQWLVDQAEVYILPLMAGFGLVANAAATKTIKAKLSGE